MILLDFPPATTALSAGVATDVLGLTGAADAFGTHRDGVDVSQVTRLGVTLRNVGANPITAAAIYLAETTDGVAWSLDGSFVFAGPLAAGASTTIEQTDLVRRRTRLVVTSAVGSSVEVTVHAAGPTS